MDIGRHGIEAESRLIYISDISSRIIIKEMAVGLTSPGNIIGHLLFL